MSNAANARHHAEWLSLVESAGPFLSLQVLMDAFPQGLEAHEPEVFQVLRQVYGEWLDDRDTPGIHRAWVEWVLAELLEFPEAGPNSVLRSGQGIPAGLQVTIAEYRLTLRPDWVLVTPQEAQPLMLVQLVPPGQGLEKTLKNSLWKVSPATAMLELLRGTGVQLGLVTNGEQWMLVHAPQRGAQEQSAGYISWYSNLWLEEKVTLRAFRSLLGVRRVLGADPGETLVDLLAQSRETKQEVTDQLGFQVRKAVEVLVQAIDRIDQDRNRSLLQGLSETVLYQAALTVMMRLVFLFSAEERELLLLGNALYDQSYAVSTLGAQLRELADQHGEELLERRYDAWSRLLATFRAVFGGINHDLLQLPAYGGQLFDPDRFPFLEGRSPGSHWLETPAQPVPINNRTVLHLLEALQVLQVRMPGGGVEPRRLSFSALDIEDIGHVYEGLLDHTAVRATGTILGLGGTKNREPEVALAELERLLAEDEAALLKFLKKETGRSVSALKKRLPDPHPSPLPKGEGTRSSLPSPLGRGVGGEGQINWGAVEMQRLRVACHNDEELFGRVLPWVGLMRLDTFGYPVVIPAGSVFVTEGADRRETGTHYTPRSLTEEIVKHTLEPLVYGGVAEGAPREAWRLRSAAELLELKVCDMAMGSGAFLVEVCRYLSARLVEAWEMEIPKESPLAPLFKGGKVEDVDAPLAKGGKEEVPLAKGDLGGSPCLRILPDGSLSRGEPGETVLPEDLDERLALARRLVADRCLYGVDKNPMAVEMAKLSLWLITLQKDRPFTFLDHALRCGDSLLGVTRPEQIEFLHLNPDNRAVQLRTVSEIWKPLLARAIAKRRELESFPVKDIQDLARKEALQAEAEALTANIKIAADYLIGEALAQAGKTGNLKLEDLSVLSGLVTAALEEGEAAVRERKLQQIREAAQRMLNAGKPEGSPDRGPFHWALEFPEVFLEGSGFSAIVGNPPFQGGKKITGAVGTDYRTFLVEYLAKGVRGNADLCAYFFLNAGRLVSKGGHFGLVATNTIAQGDTREVGLDQLVAQGYTIPRAVPSRPWPGTAALEVAYVWLRKGGWQRDFVLDEKSVKGITPFLTVPGKSIGNPYRLVANANQSFQGSIVLGMGFVLEPAEAAALIAKDPKNKEVLFPYLNGQDLNTNPDQSPSRWVINFKDWPLDADHDDPKNPKGPPYAADYPDCLAIVEEKVKPERTRLKENGEFALRKPLPQKWWIYADKRPALYETIAACDRVLVCPIVTKYLSFVFTSKDYVYMHKLTVFPLDKWQFLGLLQSTVHEIWSRDFSSTLETRLNYSPADCFETFPFPENSDNPAHPATQALESIGQRYYSHRQAIMQTRQEGLTKTYNRFHDPTCTDPDIQTLRHLHREMDHAVAAAYGWQDLLPSPPGRGAGGEGLNHGFHDIKQGTRYTISETARREILDRLLALNHQRYAQEVAQGLHQKKKTKTKRTKTAKPPKTTPQAPPSPENPIQNDLF